MSNRQVDATKVTTLTTNLEGGTVADPEALQQVVENYQATINQIGTDAGDVVNLPYSQTNHVGAINVLANAPDEGLFRNAIINGNPDIWQRGTSFTTQNAYTADRWQFVRNGAASSTISRDTSVPANGKSKYSLKGTGDYAAGEIHDLKYHIEGKDAAKFSGRKVTFTFQHKESVTAGATSISLLFAYASAEDNFSTIEVVNSVSISPSASFAENSHSVTLPATSPSGYSIANGIQIIIRYTQSVTVGTLAQNIAQVQLCAGDVALPYQPRSFAEELRLCQRYYEKSYDQSVAPGAVNASGSVSYVTRESIGASSSGFLHFGNVNFKVPKRITPTVVIYSPEGAANAIRNMSASNDRTGVTGNLVNANAIGRLAADNTSANAIALDALLRFQWVADAEL